MALVLDASALVLATTAATPDARRLATRMRLETCHAPHLVDAEAGNALRRMVGAGEISATLAEQVLAGLGPLIDQRYALTPALARVAWAMRQNVTFYDALFVALAAAMSVSLITADRRFESSVNRQTGAMNFTYVEDTQQTKGVMKLPEKIAIMVAPWRFAAPVDMMVFLRYRLNEGKLSFYLKLDRPDMVLDEAFGFVVKDIEAAVGLPILMR